MSWEVKAWKEGVDGKKVMEARAQYMIDVMVAVKDAISLEAETIQISKRGD